MTSKQRAAQAAPEQTTYRVRIAFESARVGDRFTMSGTDPYVQGLLGAGLIEPVRPDELEATAAAQASRGDRADASATPQGTAEPSRVDEPLQARHVTPARDDDASPRASNDASSPPADATP